ncbi:MAG: ABC transporter ATP-binding protein [Clostridia bacterium]|nr:ABC transporter ATP-binding protein [Clostridia bacterium]
MLEVNNINVYYGSIHAIKNISFEVNSGEIVTLIGANGAGKSTTLQTISGLLRSKTGSITFMGKNLGGIAAHKVVSMGIAHVPEGRRIFQQMTVEENIEMGAFTRPGNEYEQSVQNVFAHFPRLQERRKQIAGTLSGGEQQMLAMGRAMMSKPSLLMLDEPSMGLSPILVDEIFEIIKAFHDSGTTILLVEQNANKSLAISGRAYVLENGKIVLTGTGKELMQSEEIKKAYLGG